MGSHIDTTASGPGIYELATWWIVGEMEEILCHLTPTCYCISWGIEYINWSKRFSIHSGIGNKMEAAELIPRAPSYLNSRLLVYVTIGCIEPRTHYLGNWSPRVCQG